MIPQLQESTTVSVVGPIASGKTYLLKKWCESMPRVVIFDPTGEHVDGEQFWGNPRAFCQYLKENPLQFRATYHPGANINEGFEYVASALWQLDEPRWLVIEEIHELINPHWRHEKMRIIMKYARKRFLGVIGSTQAIADLHKDFTRASRLNVLFHTTEPRDLETIRERWGDETENNVLTMRPLIFDDVSGTTQQTPQAVVIERGQPAKVEDIG